MTGDQILLYLGAFLPLAWGTAHLFPTRSVVGGFGDLSQDNKCIITMEWIIEGVALIFIGVLIATVTTVDHTTTVSRVVYWISFLFLNILSVVSLFTGFRIKMVPFRLCPVIFTTASVLLLVGGCL